MAISAATVMTTSAERVRSPARSPAVKLASPTAITWIHGVGECVLVTTAAHATRSTIGSGQIRRAANGRTTRTTVGPMPPDRGSSEVSSAISVSPTTGPSA